MAGSNPTGSTVSEALAGWASALTWKSLPAEVVAMARGVLLGTLGGARQGGAASGGRRAAALAPAAAPRRAAAPPRSRPAARGRGLLWAPRARAPGGARKAARRHRP